MVNFLSLDLPRLQMFEKTQKGLFSVSEFLVKSFINKHCHNSGTGNNIDIKFRLVTKLDKKNVMTSKGFENCIMSENYDVIILF